MLNIKKYRYNLKKKIKNIILVGGLTELTFI